MTHEALNGMVEMTMKTCGIGLLLFFVWMPASHAVELKKDTLVGALVGVDPRVESGTAVAYEDAYSPEATEPEETTVLPLRTPRPSRLGYYEGLRSPLIAPDDVLLSNTTPPNDLVPDGSTSPWTSHESSSPTD